MAEDQLTPEQVTEQEAIAKQLKEEDRLAAEAATKLEEEAKQKAKKDKKTKGMKKYNTKLRMWHPYQQKYLEVGEQVELELDTWLESQIEAGIVTEA